MIILAALLAVVIVTTASATDNPPPPSQPEATVSDPGPQPAHRCRGPPPTRTHRPDGGQAAGTPPCPNNQPLPPSTSRSPSGRTTEMLDPTNQICQPQNQGATTLSHREKR